MGCLVCKNTYKWGVEMPKDVVQWWKKYVKAKE